MTAHELWLRLAAGWLLAACLFVLADPPAPASPWPAPAAALLGVGVAPVLYAVLWRRSPRLQPPRSAARLLADVLLVVDAGGEEVVWRWFGLGELGARTALPVALALSSLLFAASHRAGFACHCATGAAFGGVFLATGSLAGCWCVHAVYNLLAATGRRSRARRVAWSRRRAAGGTAPAPEASESPSHRGHGSRREGRARRRRPAGCRRGGRLFDDEGV